MTNTVLTPSMILKEAYAIMHQTGNFISNTNRQYDDRFANRQLQIGQSLDVRLPAKYVTRDGNTMAVQNYVQRKVALPLATIKGIDLNFTQEQMTFGINDFSRDVLKPAVSQLTATVEADALSLYKKVANFSGSYTTELNFARWQRSGARMSDMLAPPSDRSYTMNTKSKVDFSDAVKGLFQSSQNIEKQYIDGVVGRTGGFTVYENTIMPAHVSGTFTGTLAITTSAAADTGFDGTGNAYPTTTTFDLKFDGTSAYAFKAGDLFTVAGVYAVHPETKQPYGWLQPFTAQADLAGTTAGTLAVSPVPILSGAYQNVSGPIANNAVLTCVTNVTTEAAKTIGQNLAFHKDAFAFVTADLEDPSQYGAWGTREVFDGLSLRIWRQGDIANGAFPCRLDIAYGFAAIYPEWACRQIHTLTEDDS